MTHHRSAVGPVHIFPGAGGEASVSEASAPVRRASVSKPAKASKPEKKAEKKAEKKSKK